MSDDAPSGLHLELSRSLPSLASGKTYSDIEHKKREGRKASIKQIGTKTMECSFELAIRGTPWAESHFFSLYAGISRPQNCQKRILIAVREKAPFEK